MMIALYTQFLTTHPAAKPWKTGDMVKHLITPQGFLEEEAYVKS